MKTPDLTPDQLTRLEELTAQAVALDERGAWSDDHPQWNEFVRVVEELREIVAPGEDRLLQSEVIERAEAIVEGAD